MSSLARSACKLLKEEGLQLDPKTLFVPSLSEYDFIIYLSPKFAGSRRGNKDGKVAEFKNLGIQTEEDLLYVGYEPVRLFVEELRVLYTSTIVLFHNESSNNVIAGVWSPQTATRTFKVNMPYATKALGKVGNWEETVGQVAIDKDTIILEMARLGGDMVFKIELRR
jgi:U3 small nucleolar RNA-associated protein 22